MGMGWEKRGENGEVIVQVIVIAPCEPDLGVLFS
jgi:hypothetical protein